MNYELAKQLKEAGFPQVGYPIKKGEFICVTPWTVNEFYCPTLSELIEACGNKNFRLLADHKGKWSAYSYIDAIGAEGDTAEEAVALLWLKLNKK